MSGNTIPLADWLALPKEARPVVSYNGQRITRIYRDPGYPDGTEHYVIVLDGYGVGSKKPATMLTVENPHA